MVGLTGFEPAASSSRTRRATKLRHSPIAGPRTPSGSPAAATIPEGEGPLEIGPRTGRSVPGDQGEQAGLGAAGDPDPGVRAGPETRGHMQPRRARVARLGGRGMAVQALGARGLEVA